MTTRISKRLPEDWQPYYMKLRGALAFAMAFMLIGMALINAFAYISPTDRYIEVQQMTAESSNDSTDRQEIHDLYVEYDAADRYYATADISFVNVGDDGETRTVKEWNFRTVVHADEENATVEMRPPMEAPAGQYRYELTVYVEAERFVTKEMTIQTETFEYDPPDSDFKTVNSTVESDGGFDIQPGTVEVTTYDSGSTANAPGDELHTSTARS